VLGAEAAEVITSGSLAHVVTLDPDGKPHVTLAWAGLEGDEIVIGTLSDQRKLRNIRRDPRVTLSFETGQTNEVGLNEYLVVHGRARVTAGGAPELLQRLARVYLGPDIRFPPMPDPPPGFVTRIAVDAVAGVGPWTSPGDS
jgi:PPOX class probable F420-dependent enzyme